MRFLVGRILIRHKKGCRKARVAGASHAPTYSALATAAAAAPTITTIRNGARSEGGSGAARKDALGAPNANGGPVPKAVTAVSDASSPIGRGPAMRVM